MNSVESSIAYILNRKKQTVADLILYEIISIFGKF